MCDYSLMGIPNRLAVKEEELVVHKFRTGSMGLASPVDLEATTSTERPKGLWASVRSFFNPPAQPSVPAVCIPPGAELVMEDIPVCMQRTLGAGSIELVTFTQITPPTGNVPGQVAAVGTYRDAVRFRHGREIRLQDLREGQRMWVMDLSGADTFLPVRHAVLGV